MRIYVDMDDVICAYTKGFIEARDNDPTIDFPQRIEGFFQNLKPIENAVESVNELRNQRNLEVYILTAPSTRNPHSYTEKRLWVEEYFDYEFTKKLIMSSNKGLLKGDLLIDDHDSGRGQETFEGEFILFGSRKYPDWNSVMDYIKNRNFKVS